MFQNIIGNDKIKNELKRSVEINRYSHSYLFIGKSGIGKKMIAREFAKMILCENEKPYCNKCKSCLEFDSGNNPDFQEVIPDGNNIKIEQIRELQRKIVESPIISSKKVYIIDDADKLTREAQNCLLKTLEEPPLFAIIVLIGSNESNFLSTIKSRCNIIKFEPLEIENLKKYFKENYPEEEISKVILDAADCSIGKLVELKDKKDLYESINNLINNIENLDIIDIIKNASNIYSSQNEKNEILDYINVLLYKKATKDYKYLNCIDIVEQTKKRLNANSNYNMSIDNMLMTIWEEIH